MYLHFGSTHSGPNWKDPFVAPPFAMPLLAVANAAGSIVYSATGMQGIQGGFGSFDMVVAQPLPLVLVRTSGSSGCMHVYVVGGDGGIDTF